MDKQKRNLIKTQSNLLLFNQVLKHIFISCLVPLNEANLSLLSTVEKSSPSNNGIRDDGAKKIAGKIKLNLWSAMLSAAGRMCGIDVFYVYFYSFLLYDSDERERETEPIYMRPTKAS